MRNTFLLTLAAAFGVIGFFAGTQAATPKLSSQDYNEIHALYARYAHAYDRSNSEAYGNVFTADGEFHAGQRVLKGRKEISALATTRGPLKEHPKVLHVNSNVLIEPSPEGAKGSAYVVLMDLTKNPAITGGGVYEDAIVKTPDGWRFKKRAYFAETAPSASQTSSK